MKLKITIDLDKTPITEITDKELEKATNNLPRKTVKVSSSEIMNVADQNAKPFEYTVKKGDTLKKIASRFGISYGELSTFLLSTESTTSIYAGQVIKIPRHFIDLTEAS